MTDFRKFFYFCPPPFLCKFNQNRELAGQAASAQFATMTKATVEIRGVLALVPEARGSDRFLSHRVVPVIKFRFSGMPLSRRYHLGNESAVNP